MRNPVNILFICGVFGLAGVLTGAFGAHALKETLAVHGSRDLWETAVFYQLIHALGLLGVAAWRGQSAPSVSSRDWLAWAARWWTLGIVFFSGSLYALALGAPSRLLWPVTPLGGLALMLGWSCVIAQARTQISPGRQS